MSNNNNKGELSSHSREYATISSSEFEEPHHRNRVSDPDLSKQSQNIKIFVAVMIVLLIIIGWNCVSSSAPAPSLE